MADVSSILRQGLSRHQNGQLALADQCYRQVLAADPDNVNALHLLGVVAHQTGQYAAAVELIGRAISLAPNIPEFYNNLGEAYRELRDFERAIAAYGRAIQMNADFAEAHNNLGTAYHNLRRFDEALACYGRAIDLRPDYANPHYNRGRTLLTIGQLESGWREYDWRWQKIEFRRPPLGQPLWDGSPLAGRKLLVRAEQGLGDTLQFARYVRLLTDQGNQVVFESQPALMPLLTESGYSPLVAQEGLLPDYDVYAYLVSLPGLLGTTLENIPANVPYLSANPQLVDQWRARLNQSPGFKVGLQWQVSKGTPQAWRSIPLAAYESLARLPGVQLVSLQKGYGTEQIPAFAERHKVLDFTPELDEAHGPFMDTAALATALDLVITADSSMAHLVGGLGRPVWTVLPQASDWRWLVDREDCPWYPTMRLFRQLCEGDWSDVIARVTAALAQHMTSPAR